MKNNSTKIKYFIVGGAVSLITTGAALLSGTAHAELNLRQISQSYDDMINSLDDKVTVPADKKEKVESTPQSSHDDDTLSTANTQTNATNKEMLFEAKESVPDVNMGKKHDEDTATKMQIDDLSMIQKATKDSCAEELKNITNEQKLYVLQALNLSDAYALLQSEVVENLRIFGEVDKIELDKNYHRIYSADDGDAMTKLLYMIYPSNAGYLSVHSGGDRPNFSKNGGASSETIARFCAILNDYRNGKIARIPKKNVKVVLPGPGCKNKINHKVNETQIIVQGSLADFLKRYGFKAEEMYNIESVKGKEKISFSKATFCYDFITTLLDCVDLEKTNLNTHNI